MSDDELLKRLEAHLDYRFRDRSFLRDALTHRSYRNEYPQRTRQDNERMEFLGDAVLELAASSLLYERFGNAREGELTRRRADLVCERSLSKLAQSFDLGDAMYLGKGEEKSGGRQKPRLLASSLEAVVAAVHLDGGAESALRVARTVLTPHVDAEAPGARDYKSRLQELLQGRGQAPPQYELVAEEGPDHDRTFHVRVAIEGGVTAEGHGRSKLRAEQAAAQAALAALTVE